MTLKGGMIFFFMVFKRHHLTVGRPYAWEIWPGDLEGKNDNFEHPALTLVEEEENEKRNSSL